MPFMKGKEAFRNTLKYLQQGQIVFKHDVKVMMINYNVGGGGQAHGGAGQGDTSSGIRDMVFWHVNQIQYKNPQTQIVAFKNMTPTPFITFILGSGKKLYVDVDGKNKDDILSHVREILGKSDEELKEEEVLEDQATFGFGSRRFCMCEVPGQVPCPGFVTLPKEMRGKYQAALSKGEIEDIS